MGAIGSSGGAGRCIWPRLCTYCLAAESTSTDARMEPAGAVLVHRRALVLRHRSSVGLGWPPKGIEGLHLWRLQCGRVWAMRLALRSDGCAQPTTFDR